MFTEEAYRGRARSHDMPIASEPTWSYIQQQLDIYHPTRVLEVGGAVGVTTCRLAATLKQRGGMVYSYEVSYPAYRLACRRRTYTASRNTMMRYGDITTKDLSADIGQPIDFVFLDAMKTQYAQYLHQIRPCCCPGAIIIADDVGTYGNKMDTFWQYLAQEKLNWERIDLEDDSVIHIYL